MRIARGEQPARRGGVERLPIGLDEIHRPSQIPAVDLDLENVAVAQLANRTAGQGFRPDMAEAGAGRDAGEARISHDRYGLSPGQILERRRQLVGLFHPGAEWSRTDQDDDVVCAHWGVGEAFDGANGVVFGHEDACRPPMAVDVVIVDHGRIDRRRFDDRALRRDVADREDDGAREPGSARAVRVHDHVIGIDPVGFLKTRARLTPAIAVLPPIQDRCERRAADGGHIHIEDAQAAQMQHDLGHAAGKKDLHGGMVARPVGQRVNQARCRAIDARPVVKRRPAEARGVRDRRDMEQEIRRAADGRMDEHRVLERGGRENRRQRCLVRRQLHQRQRRSVRHVQPHRFAGGCERAVWQAQAERLGDDLRGRRRAEELAPAARRTACAAPIAAAVSRVIRPCANRAPIDCTFPASSAPAAGSVTPPGTMIPGRSAQPASASIIAGRPLSQVAMPITPDRRGSERTSRRIVMAASLRYGRLSNMPVVP